jgi:hypothetical protein
MDMNNIDDPPGYDPPGSMYSEPVTETGNALATLTPAAGLVFQGADALRRRLADYTEERKVFVEWLRASLVPGEDYQLIHRKLGGAGQPKTPCPNKDDKTSMRCNECGAKPALSKSGSEKIDALLQLRPSFARDGETWEMLGSPAGVLCLTCTLVTTRGDVAGEGRGIRNVADDYNDHNKAIKMAEKSAQIDATLRVSGVSELFTQPHDEKPEGNGTPAPKPASERPASPPPQPTQPSTRPTTPVGASALAVKGVFAPEVNPKTGKMQPWKVLFSDGTRASTFLDEIGQNAQRLRDRHAAVTINVAQNKNPKYEPTLLWISEVQASGPPPETNGEGDGEWDQKRFIKNVNKLAFRLGDSEFQDFMREWEITGLDEIKAPEMANKFYEALKRRVEALGAQS